VKKELKHQIKEDEFASGLEKAAAWAGTHRDELRIGLAAAAVLLAAGGAFAWFQGQRVRDAERAFQDALDAWSAPVASEIAPGADRPTGQVFATAEEKYKAAAAAFDGVVQRYGSLDLGRRSRYYAALARIELKQYAEAEKALKEVQAAGGSGLERPLARLALADLYARSGELDKAIDTYRSFASDPAAGFPRDHALFALAGALEAAKRTGEARAVYVQLTEDFPASVYATEARQRAEFLKTAVES
jgi:TolA-binding protein